jgi:hypothetical protein
VHVLGGGDPGADAHGSGDSVRDASCMGTEDEAHGTERSVGAAESGGCSETARSRRKSSESSAGTGLSRAKGNVDSSKRTCREVMMRRVERSRQR